MGYDTSTIKLLLADEVEKAVLPRRNCAQGFLLWEEKESD
jgi:hypothetical protein